MGLEAQCTARWSGRSSGGKAQLETDALRFRGEFRFEVPLRQVGSAAVSGGVLTVCWPEGEAELELGTQAERWAERIRNPKSLLDRLGVKPGMRVACVELQSPEFLSELEERGIQPETEPEDGNLDLVFCGIEHRDALHRLTELQAGIRRNGAIWTIRRRGNPDVTERDVLEAARAHGLVDVKVARFSETHTAEKLVIPKERR